MKEISILKNNLTKIQGRLTSNIRTRASSNTPYYAFFRSDANNRHSLTECQHSKCRDCEIPIIFRIKAKPINKIGANDKHCLECGAVSNNPNRLPHSWYCRYNKTSKQIPVEDNWVKPKLEKAIKLILQGNWTKSDQSSRPSFTVYSLQKLND